MNKQGKNQHTLVAYQRALEHFIRWSETAYGKPFDPEQAMARDLRDWKAYQQSVEKATATTVKQRPIVLCCFFNWAS